MNLFNKIPESKVLLQPMRLDVLRHLVVCGGRSPLSDTRKAVGEPCRQLVADHCGKLEDAGFVEQYRHIVGNVAVTDLILTDKARQALAVLGREVGM